MNLNEGNVCKHGMHWTSPVPCSKCISERRGVWADYGGYGSPYDAAKHGDIHCAMCKRVLSRAELGALVAEATSGGRYVRAFTGGPDETEPERERLRIHHCHDCEPECKPCQSARGKKA